MISCIIYNKSDNNLVKTNNMKNRQLLNENAHCDFTTKKIKNVCYLYRICHKSIDKKCEESDTKFNVKPNIFFSEFDIGI